MNYSFISVVSLAVADGNRMQRFLENVYNVLHPHFSNFEIILVNNKVHHDIRALTSHVDNKIREHVTVVNLSKPVREDNAIFAGLERANGDYSLFFDMQYWENCDIILDLYASTQNNSDIVFVKNTRRKLPFMQTVFYVVFKFLISSLSKLDLDITNEKTRIISRRALNGLLQLRESNRSFKSSFSYLGFESSYVKTNVQHNHNEKFNFYQQIKDTVISLVSFSEVLNKMIFIIFILALLFSFMVSLDTVLLKFYHTDLFGTIKIDYFPGYPFMIIMISVMFTIVCLILFLLSLYLDIINKEIRKRPPYFIKSIQRL
ncbi:MAG TPA: hypothetical protein VHO72_02835 [Bacteroidales bacterium]|nr:hypothetical protein [Bacteroidales bacterium]